MHDLFFPFYSVGIEPKVNTGTFGFAKIVIFSMGSKEKCVKNP